MDFRKCQRAPDEMDKAELAFIGEIEMNIFYKDKPEPVGPGRSDFMVENKVLEAV